MYSFEDRLRAVQLYSKLGNRAGLTIRQLGYPTNNALKSWHREYEKRIDLPAGYSRREKFTHAQQERAVTHYLENGRCISATIGTLESPYRKLLCAWVQEWRPERRLRIVGRSRELSATMHAS